jgi:hypothetical protein
MEGLQRWTGAVRGSIATEQEMAAASEVASTKVVCDGLDE